ncbi:hypothetical protein HA402_011513 [Bradysia odoriphaga]|nr:hypothetical protein HA402_011513 [Bradysia odoriphaga]
MASRLLISSRELIKSLNKLSLTRQITTNFHKKCELSNKSLLEIQPPTIISMRHTSFFNKLSADRLWTGCLSVSNPGRKRGRANRLGKRKDLNKGQVIGVGKTNMVWPGLNAPVVQGRELIKQQKLPENPDWEGNLRNVRDKMSGKKRFKLSPLERGWAGGKANGRSMGPPDPIGGYKFDDFDSRILELKLVFIMKGNLGRKRRQSAFVVVGNGNGLAGFASAKAVEGRNALRKAKNRAAQKLMNIKVHNGHTVMHPFFCQFGLTKIYVSMKPPGYGLVCHRAIRTICEMVGIKDIHAKIEGATSVQHVTKAFFMGLLQQRTHEEIAEESGLHLVEMRSENDYFPKIIASPTECRKADEIPSNENLDFTHYMMNGKIIQKKKKFPPFFTKHRSWDIYCRKQEKIRNQDKVKIDLSVHYGEVRSFYTDKYPECRQAPSKPRDAKVAED